MSDITVLLQQMHQGDGLAPEKLLSQVYAELRQLAAAKMAREQPGQTLQATALVHEAWLKLGDAAFENRAHFFAAASEAMRRILVDQARRKLSAKRGGRHPHVDIGQVEVAAAGPDEETLAVHEALDELAAAHPSKAELVKLIFFVGLTFEEAAAVMGTSATSAKREWAYARGWLHRKIMASA